MGVVAELGADVGLAAVLFATTNVDDLVVLVALFADRATDDRAVAVGQVLGIGALTAAALVLARAALALPDRVVGLCGLVPIALGLRLLLGWWRNGRPSGDDDGIAPRLGLGPWAVAGVTVANGGDNVAVYVPAFTTLSAAGVVATTAVFAVGTALWLLAARALVRQRHVGPVVARWGERLLPFVLITVGVLVLAAHR